MAKSDKPSSTGGYSRSDAKKFAYGKRVGGKQGTGRLGADSSRSPAGRKAKGGKGANRQS